MTFQSPKSKDIRAPKKPPSGYFLFSAERRPQIKAHAQRCALGWRTKDINKALLKEWKTMSNNIKKIYQRQSNEARTAYYLKLQEYNKKQEYKKGRNYNTNHKNIKWNKKNTDHLSKLQQNRISNGSSHTNHKNKSKLTKIKRKINYERTDYKINKMDNKWKYNKKNGRKSKSKTYRNGAIETGGMVVDTLIFSELTNNKKREAKTSFATGEVNGKHGSASYDICGVGASTESNALGVRAQAYAHVAHAEAAVNTGLPGNLFAPNASATALGANASAEATILGVRAQTEATVAKVQAGIKDTPLNVSASGPSASAGASLRVDDMSASVAAYTAEATAGPFAVRSGVKFGAGVRNGVPEIHLGPVSAPCLIM